MRPIGQLNTKEQAQLFVDYLLVHHIDAQLDESRQGGWTIWVLDEDDVDKASALLSRFRSMPDAGEFDKATRAAQKMRQHMDKELPIAPAAAPSVKPPWTLGFGGLTFILMMISLAVTLLSDFGKNPEWTRYILFSLPAIKNGEVWRLVTPIFLHLDIWHLLFNMFWLKDLGGALEEAIGTRRLLVLVLIIAIISNCAQGLLVGRDFGGMSGVIYGLFGYMWMRRKMDLTFHVWLTPFAGWVLMIFLALGILGVLPGLANAAHVGGLLCGGLLGWVMAQNAFRIPR